MRDLIFFVLSVFVFISCENVLGPDYDITVENNTSVDQTFSIEINGGETKEYTVAAGSSITISFTGAYEKSDLTPPYTWKYGSEDRWIIDEAPLTDWIIKNELDTAVTLKDSNIASYSFNVPEHDEITEQIHLCEHSFYLEGDEGNNGYITVTDTDGTTEKKYYEITVPVDEETSKRERRVIISPE